MSMVLLLRKLTGSTFRVSPMIDKIRGTVDDRVYVLSYSCGGEKSLSRSCHLILVLRLWVSLSLSLFQTCTHRARWKCLGWVLAPEAKCSFVVPPVSSAPTRLVCVVLCFCPPLPPSSYSPPLPFALCNYNSFWQLFPRLRLNSCEHLY